MYKDKVYVKDTFTSHIDKKIFLTFLLTPYLYTFSLYMKILDVYIYIYILINKGNNKITKLRTILQRESQNS